MAEANDYMLKAERDEQTARFEARRKEWERTRRRGRAFFLLRVALIFGGLMFVYNFFWDLFTQSGWQHQTLAPFTLAGLPVCMFIGALLGFWIWHKNEGRFRNESKDRNPITKS